MLLMLFKPRPDVMCGTLDAQGGELVGVFASSSTAAKECKFDQVLPAPPPDVLPKSKAVVIGLQRRNVG